MAKVLEPRTSADSPSLDGKVESEILTHESQPPAAKSPAPLTTRGHTLRHLPEADAQGSSSVDVVSDPPTASTSASRSAPLAVLVKAALAQTTQNSELLSVPPPLVNVEESFELKIVQQPGIGAQAGLDKVTLGRLPIVPAPIVQVFAKDASGQPIDKEFPYLLCSCALRSGDGKQVIETVHTSGPSTSTRTAPLSNSLPSATEQEFSALIGNLVSNSQRVSSLEGDLGNYFVFEDLAVREKGTYTLEFRLGKIQRPSSPKLASVVSEPFDVVDWRSYPGRPASDVLTSLSRHLANQGVPMYIPPLHDPPAMFES